MKCDRCDQEATVHELRVVGGKKVEKHLCEKCARDQGIAVQPPVTELIAKYVMAQAPGVPAATPAPAPAAGRLCRACGTTYAEFRQSGLLGCPECYAAFEAQLGPLLERAHEGGTHHVGKVPVRALARSRAGGSGSPGVEAVLGGERERAERIKLLKKQLDEAVAGEQYERAAEIRDELRRIAELEAGGGKPVRKRGSKAPREGKSGGAGAAAGGES